MHATFSISEYGFFGFPDSAGSSLRPETFSVLYLLHSSYLENCLTRSQASTKSYWMKQWSWDWHWSVRCKGRALNPPTPALPQLFLPSLLLWCCAEQITPLLETYQVSANSSQAPFFLFSLQCLTLLSCISYREVSRPASMSLRDLPLPEGPSSPMAQGQDWS